MILGAAMTAHVYTMLAATLTPTPTPDPGFDQTTVTPGVAGFLITFGVAAVALLLILDMTRRIRRTRYREEIRAKLEAERDARAASGSEDGAADSEDGAAGGTAGTTPAPGTQDDPRTP